jgi:hypothetical protein
MFDVRLDVFPDLTHLTDLTCLTPMLLCKFPRFISLYVSRATLLPGSHHHAKPGLAAHHSLVSLRDAFERIHLVHGAHPGEKLITVADAAGLNFYPHLAGARLGNFTFNDFKRSARTGDLRGTHLWHKKVLVAPKSSRLESGTLWPGGNRKTF